MGAFRRIGSSSFTVSIRSNHLDQTVKVSVPGLPIRNMLINQPLKTSPVVVMAEVGEFMGDNIAVHGGCAGPPGQENLILLSLRSQRDGFQAC